MKFECKLVAWASIHHLVSTEKEASVQRYASGGDGWVLGCGSSGYPNPVSVIRNKATKQTDLWLLFFGYSDRGYLLFSPVTRLITGWNIKKKHSTPCIYVYCTLTEVFLNLTQVFLTPTEGFPCFFLSYKANARVKLAKTGHGPHSSTLVVICVVRLLFVLFYVTATGWQTQLQLINVSSSYHHAFDQRDLSQFARAFSLQGRYTLISNSMHTTSQSSSSKRHSFICCTIPRQNMKSTNVSINPSYGYNIFMS
jgi:hypothetical protein